MHYNRFRYYDPLSGQYTQQDPIGLAGGTPLLSQYVDDPVGWIDPLGLHRNCSDPDKLVSPSSNPGTAQSRVNVAKVTKDGSHDRGFNYAMGKHGSNSTMPGKSKYSIPNSEVKSLLQTPKVVKSPVYNPKHPNGTIETNKFVRQVDVGRKIGNDQNGNNTSTITVISNRQGNLINTFPGVL